MVEGAIAASVGRFPSEEEVLMAKAATDLQAVQRGKADRVKVAQLQKEKAVEAVVAATGCTHETASRAVEFVGSSVEKAVAFVKKQAEQHKAATKVQAAQRGRLDRATVAQLKLDKAIEEVVVATSCTDGQARRALEAVGGSVGEAIEFLVDAQVTEGIMAKKEARLRGFFVIGKFVIRLRIRRRMRKEREAAYREKNEPAAIVVQTAERGKAARAELKKRKEEKKAAEEEAERLEREAIAAAERAAAEAAAKAEAAAITLQAVQRGKVDRLKAKEIAEAERAAAEAAAKAEAAVITLQAVQRGKVDRLKAKEAKKEKRKRDAERLEAMRQKAAGKVQAVAQGMKTRKLLRKQRKAACTIEAMARRKRWSELYRCIRRVVIDVEVEIELYYANLAAEKAAAEQREAERHAAATRLQAQERMRVAKAKREEALAAARKLQARQSTKSSMAFLRKCKDGALRLQCNWRGVLGRRLTKLKRGKLGLATRMQAIFRGFHVRVLRSAVNSLISSLEFMNQMEIKRREAAVVIQREFHSRKAARNMRLMRRTLKKMMMNRSIALIQRVFRKLRDRILQSTLNALITGVLFLSIRNVTEHHAAKQLQRAVRARIAAKAEQRAALRAARQAERMASSLRASLGQRDVTKAVPWSTYAKLAAHNPPNEAGLALYGGPPRRGRRRGTPLAGAVSGAGGLSSVVPHQLVPNTAPDLAELEMEMLDQRLLLLSASSTYGPQDSSYAGGRSRARLGKPYEATWPHPTKPSAAEFAAAERAAIAAAARGRRLRLASPELIATIYRRGSELPAGGYDPTEAVDARFADTAPFLESSSAVSAASVSKLVPNTLPPHANGPNGAAFFGLGSNAGTTSCSSGHSGIVLPYAVHASELPSMLPVDPTERQAHLVDMYQLSPRFRLCDPSHARAEKYSKTRAIYGVGEHGRTLIDSFTQSDGVGAVSGAGRAGAGAVSGAYSARQLHAQRLATPEPLPPHSYLPHAPHPPLERPAAPPPRRAWGGGADADDTGGGLGAEPGYGDALFADTRPVNTGRVTATATATATASFHDAAPAPLPWQPTPHDKSYAHYKHLADHAKQRAAQATERAALLRTLTESHGSPRPSSQQRLRQLHPVLGGAAPMLLPPIAGGVIDARAYSSRPQPPASRAHSPRSKDRQVNAGVTPMRPAVTSHFGAGSPTRLG